MKNGLLGFLLAVAIIVASIGSTYLFTNYKMTVNNVISATGSAELDIESDLIVWRGHFSASSETSIEAYRKLKNDSASVKEYLVENGVAETEMVFSAVDVNEMTEPIYDNDGNWRGEKKVGYSLSQKVSVTSKELDKIEKISRDISKLLEDGVEFISYMPEYYSTTLADMKLELIDKATKNAKERIDIMAKNTGAQVLNLKSSRLGVFQIVPKNSGTSAYAYDGYLDTSSRKKTASITVRLEYVAK